MLIHLPADDLKAIQKTFLFCKKPVYFSSVSYDRRNYNSKGLTYTGLTVAQKNGKKNKNMQKTGI